MMSLWDALRMNMMISYQELVRTFLSVIMGNAFAFELEPVSGDRRKNTVQSDSLLFLCNFSLNLRVDSVG
ncbi:Uncharacterised protein [Klebsiella pneumoniae]|nr:Uncharacterised protein [Klebsiella pneumoniae]